MLECLTLIAAILLFPYAKELLPDAVLAVLLLIIVLLCLPGLLLMVRGNPPFVPTSNRTRKAMIEMANIRPGELVVDPGCGNGRLLTAASALGARTLGYEYSLPTFAAAWLRSLFWQDMKILHADFWLQDFSKVDVVLCYLLQDKMQEFELRIWPTLKKGARVSSNAFTMKGVPYVDKRDGAYLYIKS